MRTSFTCRSTALAAVLTGACLGVACGSKDSDGDKGGAGAPASGSGGTTGGSASGGAGAGAGSAGASGAAAGRAASGGSGTSGGASGSGTTGGVSGSGPSAGAPGGGGATGAAGRGGASGAGTGGSGDAGASPGGAGGMAAGGSGGTGTGGGGLKDPKPSKGCSATPVTPPMSGMASIDVGGTSRDYIIRIPAAYDGTSPMRIIFAFHGMSGSAVQVDNGDPPNTGLDPTGPYYGIKEHADDHTIFVAGQAKGSWNDGDIDYVKALVAKFEDELCLDESRILATGFSMGGIMTLRVACNLYDVFRAVAPMSCSLSASNCPAGGDHIAYWSSHGEQDTTINISNGEAARDEFAKRNGCTMTTMPIGSDGCVAYQGCDDGYPVNWCPFMGIHEPPPFSGPAIWNFLSAF